MEKKHRSRSPENVKKYNDEYYQKHSREIAEKKRKRYQENTDYRKNMLARSKEQRQALTASRGGRVVRVYNGKEVLVHKIGNTAKMLGISTYQIIDWEQKKLLPKNVFGISRVYTNKQVQLIAIAKEAVWDTGIIAKAVKLVGVKIKSEWLQGL